VDVVEWFAGDQCGDPVDDPDAVDLELVERRPLEDALKSSP
jgi:hypothetical protein